MKKFFAVVICAVMIVSATACTGSNKGDNVESSAKIVNSTVSNDESSQAESNKDDSKMFASIQEYLEYPNTKKSIETMKSTLSTTLYDFDCYADGDANLVSKDGRVMHSYMNISLQSRFPMISLKM